MASDPVSYRGIVLSSTPYKEKDSMLSVLTKEDGIVKVCAKGTQKPGSHNGSASIPFAVVDIVCTLSHGFLYLKEVSSVCNNSGILTSLDAMMIAGHISRVLNFSVFQSELSKEAYELTAYAFYALSLGKTDPRLVFSAFNWRYLYITGYTALLDDKCSCGKDDGSFVFVPDTGDVFCSSCGRGYVRDGRGISLSRSALLSLDLFITSDIRKLFTLSGTPSLTDELSRVTLSALNDRFETTFEDPLII